MDQVEEEVRARLLMAELKRQGSLLRRAEGRWGRGVASFLLVAGFAAVFIFSNVGSLVILIALAGVVIGLLLEIHWTNRRIDALLTMHIRLEERLEQSRGAPMKEGEER